MHLYGTFWPRFRSIIKYKVKIYVCACIWTCDTDTAIVRLSPLQPLGRGVFSGVNLLYCILWCSITPGKFKFLVFLLFLGNYHIICFEIAVIGTIGFYSDVSGTMNRSKQFFFNLIVCWRRCLKNVNSSVASIGLLTRSRIIMRRCQSTHNLSYDPHIRNLLNDMCTNVWFDF